MRFGAQAVLALYFHGRVFGLQRFPPTGGVLLASNHQSYFDPIAVTCALYRQGNYLARDTLFENAVFKRLIESLNAFPVKRGAGDVGAVKEILRRLRDGKVVVVFPEGTRTRDGSIGTINVNSMGVAKRAGAAVAPVVIDGAFGAWPRDRLVPRPRPIYVTYCEPITPVQVAEWSDERIAAAVAERMSEAMARSQAMRRQAAGTANCGGESQSSCPPVK
jgi:1-acyl-sn-glycerol-3-phosphate acyltransferase